MCGRERLNISGRHDQSAHAVLIDPGNAGRQIGADHWPAGRHRFELNDAEGLGSRDRREREDIRGGVVGRQVGIRHAPEDVHAVEDGTVRGSLPNLLFERALRPPAAACPARRPSRRSARRGPCSRRIGRRRGRAVQDAGGGSTRPARAGDRSAAETARGGCRTESPPHAVRGGPALSSPPAADSTR